MMRFAFWLPLLTGILMIGSLAHADLAPPYRGFELDQPRVAAPPTRSLVRNQPLVVLQGEAERTILYIPRRYQQQLMQGGVGFAAPSGPRSASFWSGFRIVAAGLSLSLALISGGLLLLKRSRVSRALVSCCVTLFFVGLTSLAVADLPPPNGGFGSPRPSPGPVDPGPKVESDIALPAGIAAKGAIDILLSNTHREMTLVLAKQTPKS